MRPSGHRAVSLLLGLALFAGVIASAVLAFLEEASTLARLSAVALVAVGGLVPIGKQLARELKPSPWEAFVSYRRRDPSPSALRTPWALLRLLPGDTIFNARSVMGGPEDEVAVDYRDESGDSDRRVWHRPGLTVTTTVRRDVVTEVSVAVDESEPVDVLVAVPRGVVLGRTAPRDMMQEPDARPPDLTSFDAYEDFESLELEWKTGPEGTLTLELHASRRLSTRGSEPFTDVPFTRCVLSFSPGLGGAKRTWRGWPPADL